MVAQDALPPFPLGKPASKAAGGAAGGAAVGAAGKGAAKAAPKASSGASAKAAGRGAAAAAAAAAAGESARRWWPLAPQQARRLRLAALVLLVLGAVVLAVGSLYAVLRAPAFTLAGVEIEGTLQRTHLPTLRAVALPGTQGNFFAMDLAAAQRSFEQVPWVRRAVVRRVFPNRLAVRLEEHVPAALWNDGADNEGAGNAGSADRLVNSFGELFQANLGDVDEDSLPLLSGPEHSAAQVLAMWRRLQPVFQTAGHPIERLALSPRGAWRTELKDGAVVELGRGSDDEVLARTERFLRTVDSFIAREKLSPMVHADLRHAGGYALKLRDTVTLDSAATPRKP